MRRLASRRRANNRASSRCSLVGVAEALRSFTSGLSEPLISSFDGVSLLSSGGSVSTSALAAMLSTAIFWSDWFLARGCCCRRGRRRGQSSSSQRAWRSFRIDPDAGETLQLRLYPFTSRAALVQHALGEQAIGEFQVVALVPARLGNAFLPRRELEQSPVGGGHVRRELRDRVGIGLVGGDDLPAVLAQRATRSAMNSAAMSVSWSTMTCAGWRSQVLRASRSAKSAAPTMVVT